MKKVLFVVGPTASGKTGLAIALAERFSGEIISCDSMQIYREIAIGTAKPTPEEQKRVPHHLIDIRSVSDSFSVYDYQALALETIRLVQQKGSLPIVCGGTGLYVDALVHNTVFGEMQIDPDVRKRWEAEFEKGNAEAALQKLGEVDPEAAAKLSPKDAKRIIRALEVYESTGKTLTQFQKESRKTAPDFDFLMLYLTFRDRKKLYERIDGRVDEMMRNGLLAETEAFYKRGAFSFPTASQAIGYKELLPVILGNSDPGTAVSLLKQHTRNYAKRQITWFNRYDAFRIEMDADPDPVSTAVRAVSGFLKSN